MYTTCNIHGILKVDSPQTKLQLNPNIIESEKRESGTFHKSIKNTLRSVPRPLQINKGRLKRINQYANVLITRKNNRQVDDFWLNKGSVVFKIHHHRPQPTVVHWTPPSYEAMDLADSWAESREDTRLVLP